MTECIDPNSPEELNKSQIGLVSGASNITNNQGLFTLAAIDSFTGDFEKTIVSNTTTDNVVAASVSTFGETAFYESVRSVNSFIFTEPFDASGYESLAERRNAGVIITPFEVAQFQTEFNYTPLTLSSTIASNKNKVLFDLNFFYTASFSNSKIGSFCAIAPTIFGAVESFFDALGDLSAFIARIQNISLANIINTLKNGILGVFGGIIQAVKSVVENFSLANIAGNVEAFINETVIKKAKALKEAALSFFSEENINKIKARLSSLVDYVLGIFKNPSLEEIQYIVYRFCGLASQIEGAVQQIQKPLTSYATEYNAVYQTLATASNQNSARAIKAGALRYEVQTRKSSINTSRNDYTAAGNPPPLVIGEVDGITSWNNGKGDSRIGFGAGLQPGRMGEEGWTRVDVKARALLMRVQARFGKKLIVNSGYRSPAYNENIRKNGGGAAKKSFHMQGLAIDVTWSNFNTSNREDFIRIAREEGFRGIGRYPSFVHVDLGGRIASWNG